MVLTTAATSVSASSGEVARPVDPSLSQGIKCQHLRIGRICGHGHSTQYKHVSIAGKMDRYSTCTFLEPDFLIGDGDRNGVAKDRCSRSRL